MNIKPAFTMIELIFVIVVLGLLASIAVPKFAATRDDAIVSRARAQVSAIRSAIMTEHQRGILQGQSSWPPLIDDAHQVVGEELFDGNSSNKLLNYPIYSKNSQGGWMKLRDNDYQFYVTSTNLVDFNYSTVDMTFDCEHTDANCKLLTE